MTTDEPLIDTRNCQQTPTLRDQFAMAILSGFCANPAIFAANQMCGWSLVNCTDEQLIAYAGVLADHAVMECAK